MRSQTLVSLAASISAANAVYTGFNYGSTQTDGSIKSQQDFADEFTTAQNLVGTSGFTSARLYTMVQAGTTNTPISALQAAIDTKTSLLLGMWASGGDAGFANELAALKSAIAQYGDALSGQIAGLSIGSEDLYRLSPQGVLAGSNPGAEPATVINYISQVKDALKGTAWADIKLGHVDTWTAWANSSNNDVIKALDWIGMDAYPYFQNTDSNGIENAKSLFFDAYDQTKAQAGSTEVWITETGWPVSGKTENLGVPSTDNAKSYWDQVACTIKGNYNTYWYTLQDSQGGTPNPSFGLVGSTLSNTPLYDLSCDNVTTSSSTSDSGDKSTAKSSVPTIVATGSGVGLTPSEGAGNGAPAGSASMTASYPMSNSSATGAAAAAGTGSAGNGGSGGAGVTTTAAASASQTSSFSSGATALSINAIAGLMAVAVAAIMAAL